MEIFGNGKKKYMKGYDLVEIEYLNGKVRNLKKIKSYLYEL